MIWLMIWKDQWRLHQMLHRFSTHFMSPMNWHHQKLTNHRSPIRCTKGTCLISTLLNNWVFSILKKDYITKNGEIKTLDFQRDPKTQEEYINNKVAEVTNGMIDHIVEGLDDSTLSVIISGKDFLKTYPKIVRICWNCI